MNLPHILRNNSRLSRLLIALAILIIFGWLASLEPTGRNIQNKQEVDIASEIAKTLKVVGNRPDYAAAWLRLSLLYEKAGNEKLAKQALDKSKETGGDF